MIQKLVRLSKSQPNNDTTTDYSPSNSNDLTTDSSDIFYIDNNYQIEDIIRKPKMSQLPSSIPGYPLYQMLSPLKKKIKTIRQKKQRLKDKVSRQSRKKQKLKDKNK